MDGEAMATSESKSASQRADEERDSRRAAELLRDVDLNKAPSVSGSGAPSTPAAPSTSPKRKKALSQRAV